MLKRRKVSHGLALRYRLYCIDTYFCQVDHNAVRNQRSKQAVVVQQSDTTWNVEHTFFGGGAIERCEIDQRQRASGRKQCQGTPNEELVRECPCRMQHNS